MADFRKKNSLAPFITDKKRPLNGVFLNPVARGGMQRRLRLLALRASVVGGFLASLVTPSGSLRRPNCRGQFVAARLIHRDAAFQPTAPPTELHGHAQRPHRSDHGWSSKYFWQQIQTKIGCLASNPLIAPKIACLITTRIRGKCSDYRRYIRTGHPARAAGPSP
jgi:hypothetical protein